MTEKKDRNVYINDYKKKNYKRIPLEVTKEKYSEIQTAAAAASEAVNEYIKKAIDSRLAADLTNTSDRS